MTSARPLPTAADLLAREDERLEIVNGELVHKASPTFDHGGAQAGLLGVLFPFNRSGGGPGGWWLGAEVDIELAPDQIYRPDVAGWRKDRLPRRPSGFPVRVRPDWVCEVISPSTAGRDQVVKFRNYAKAGVGHVWFIHPEEKKLSVYRLGVDATYAAILLSEYPEIVRAEPFDAIEIPLADLFGDDETPPAT